MTFVQTNYFTISKITKNNSCDIKLQLSTYLMPPHVYSYRRVTSQYLNSLNTSPATTNRGYHLSWCHLMFIRIEELVYISDFTKYNKSWDIKPRLPTYLMPSHVHSYRRITLQYLKSLKTIPLTSNCHLMFIRIDELPHNI